MDKKWQFAKRVRRLGDVEKGYLCDVIDRGALSHFDNEGGYLQRFAEAFAAYTGSRIAIPRCNAMVALAEALSVSGASVGDEVLCDSIVHFGALAAAYFNAVPRFVDVDYKTYNMDPVSLEANISDRSKAVIVTHLWGAMADMEAIRGICDRHGLFLIEDCAHAIHSYWNGRHAGTFGNLGVFSFQEFKQLSTGDGGMTITDSEELADFIRNKMAFSGESPLFFTMNYRMNEVTAAVGLAQLEKVGDIIENTYNKTLAILNEAVKDCAWLRNRVIPEKARQSGYWFACTWEGDHHGLSYERFKELNRELEIGLRFGFNQVAPYEYDLFRNSKLYGHPDCPARCPIYTVKSDYRYQRGLCPRVEELMPRLVTVNLIFLSEEEAVITADRIREAIRLMEKG
jgi:perosamine synthetase